LGAAGEAIAAIVMSITGGQRNARVRRRSMSLRTRQPH
jgi:hypothetical protein